MAFYQSIDLTPDTSAHFWKIDEDFNTLFRSVALKDVSLARLEQMKSESHQKGFLAVRMLLQHLGYTDFDLSYDDSGKPHLNDGKTISISHSNNFSCIAVSNQKIGIDLEILKEKTLKIAQRFMNISHLQNLPKTEQLKKATIIWGIKESVFKIKNVVGISFLEHIFEDSFSLEDRKASVQLHFNNQIEHFTIAFHSVEEYIFVCAFENIP
jgi:phosphopantetheinyl transferase